MEHAGGWQRLGRYGIPAALVIVAVALSLWLTARSSDSHISASTFNPHPEQPQFTSDQAGHILAAASAVGSSVSEAELAAEGKRLFNEVGLARQGETCATCHTGGGGANSEVGAIAVSRTPGDLASPRDPPALWGIADTAPYGWVGNQPDLTLFTAGTVFAHYKPEDGFCNPCAGNDRALTPAGEKTLAALVAYMKTLEPPKTPFDEGTMSSQALLGETKFQGKGGCVSCHSGPNFTDHQIHVIGVPPLAPDRRDPGSTDIPGGFNTPTLRDIRNTAPYMHNGKFKTLQEVLDFYSGNKTVGVPVLSSQDKSEIIAYLEAL